MPSLTLYRYRCFADPRGATIHIGDGLTALIGPNNSGKTTFLRSLYELRQLFMQLGEESNLSAMVSASPFALSVVGVRDQEEIRPHGSEDLVALEISPDLYSNGAPIRIRVEEEVPTKFVAEFVFGEERTVIRERQAGELLLPDGSRMSMGAIASRLAPLGDTLYVGPHRSAVGQSSADYYDIPIGARFVSAWDRWKTGNSVRENRLINQVTETIADVFGFKRLEINAADGATDLQVVVDGNPQRLREMGAGIGQFVIALCVTAMNAPSVVLIDEPESNLHPRLQGELLVALDKLAKTGVVFSTHSVGLARSMADRVYSFRVGDEGIAVAPLERTPKLTEFLGEMSFSAWSELGAKTILLVEGVTDVRTTKEWLRLLGAVDRVVVLPLGGSQLVRQGVEEELREVTELSDRVFALVDSERLKPDGPASRERRRFAEVCEDVGVVAHLTERRATENYFPDSVVKRVKGAAYRSLQPFETLTSLQPRWGKNENWRLAAQMSLEELMASDVGEFLSLVGADAS